MSFHSTYGIDLADVWRVKSWRWFRTRIFGLLSIDSPLSRYFAPEPTEEKPEPEHDG